MGSSFVQLNLKLQRSDRHGTPLRTPRVSRAYVPRAQLAGAAAVRAVATAVLQPVEIVGAGAPGARPARAPGFAREAKQPCFVDSLTALCANYPATPSPSQAQQQLGITSAGAGAGDGAR